MSGAGERLRTLAITIVGGAIGGAVFAWLNTPLPWMLGALFVTVGLAIAGVPLYLPSWLRRIMIAVLGVMLGSAFTPDVVGHVLHWWPTLLGLAFFIGLSTSLISWFYQRFGGFDKMTAFFSASPGGLSEMVVLGPMMGGDVRKITLAHATRIVLVVMIIPPLYRLFAQYVPPALPGGGAPLAAISATDLGMLAVVGLAGFFVARAVRLPSYQMTGPMLASAAIHIFGVTTAKPPFELIAVAQVIIGCGAGVRFAGIRPRELVHPVGISTIATTGLLAIAAAFSIVFSYWTGFEFKAILLAYGPGGFAEMNLIALSLGIEVAFVATHHLARIFLVVLAAAWLAKWLHRRPA